MKVGEGVMGLLLGAALFLLADAAARPARKVEILPPASSCRVGKDGTQNLGCLAKIAAAAAKCSSVKTLNARLLGGGAAASMVEWRRCGGNWENLSNVRGSVPTSYVLVYDPERPQAVAYEFDDREFPGYSYIKKVEAHDFNRDGTDELLVYAWSLDGTDDETMWCVLGYRDGKFSCWKMPNLRGTAARRLRPDEDFCCKAWWLNYRDGELAAERWVYKKDDDGNCCPSRGSITVELLPTDGAFRAGRVSRNLHKRLR